MMGPAAPMERWDSGHTRAPTRPHDPLNVYTRWACWRSALGGVSATPGGTIPGVAVESQRCGACRWSVGSCTQSGGPVRTLAGQWRAAQCAAPGTTRVGRAAPRGSGLGRRMGGL